MLFGSFLFYLVSALQASLTLSQPLLEDRQTTDGLQNVVTWDKDSFFVHGERLVFYSGEFHPFRLPVTDLWLDVFQKIKALGFNAVSFYVDWALVEGQPGVYRADGVFALEPFFDAASEAGIYLLARPGPYINAEVSGGGFPGWLARVNGTLRTNATGYLDATDLYMQQVTATIAKAQVTNGGPVVLIQPENEYTSPSYDIIFPNIDYFRYVIDQSRNESVTVPTISNDAYPAGNFAPTPNASVGLDVYGFDSYPQGFTASAPLYWADDNLPTDFATLHQEQAPETPLAIVEFQGGSFDPWGGYGWDNCALLTNEQFQRVFYKNNWGFHVTFQNAYMVYGGSNWGNLGHPLGYSSYDYGAAIREDRAVNRPKYAELKLLANFLKVVPSYATSIPMNYTNGTYASTADIAVTPVIGNGSDTDIYIIRQAAYNSNGTTNYTITVPVSGQNITVPQLSVFSDHLTLNGRDSKVHIVNYNLSGVDLSYSTGEIFTYQQYEDKNVLVLYGDSGEVHELALQGAQNCTTNAASNAVSMSNLNGSNVIQWIAQPTEASLTCGNLQIYLLSRQDVYNWWVLELPAASPIYNFTSSSKQSVVARGAYLLRTAELTNSNLYLTGDVNQTTSLSVIAAPSYQNVYFNGQQISASNSSTISYSSPTLDLPDLASATWYSLDTLPELSSSYSDALWTVANGTATAQQFRPATSNVLYAGEYGYHSGSLEYRGHFTSPSSASSLQLSLYTQGGTAYGYSVFLNSTNIYQYPGISTSEANNLTLTLNNLTANTAYTIMLVIDHMGLTENGSPGNDTMREPRGLLSYNLTSSNAVIPVTWVLTGNFGGENYTDITRGPLNEGAFYFERQGYHLPDAPIANTSIFTTSQTPFTGLSTPGARFYATTFNLSLPTPQYDIPLAFTFTNTTSNSTSEPLKFRTLLYVNGFQFGKYVNHIGPQTSYPVPEGILNYNGPNYVGVSLWNMEDEGVQVMLGGLKLESSNVPVLSSRNAVGLSYELPQDGWHLRTNAY